MNPDQGGALSRSRLEETSPVIGGGPAAGTAGGSNIRDLYVKSVNDIKEIRSFKHLQRVNLRTDSPLFTQACQNLGILQ